MMRNKYFDIIKGILILSVVVAHFDRSVIHDVIFLFHMPLFFILSGYFLNDKKIKDYSYLISRAKSLCIPYAVYLVLDWIIRGEYSIKSIGAMIWGGRAFPGTYWYITCFIAALFMIAFLQRRFSEKSAKCIILVGGGIAVIESHLSEFIPLLKFPGVPWNIDVALIAVVYLSIGFYYKDLIKKVLVDDSKKIDITAFVAIVLLIIFCITNYCGGTMWYYFDMKPVYYKELFLAIIVPCGFGLVLVY